MRALVLALLVATPAFAAPETSPRPAARPQVQAAPQGNLELSPRPEARPAARMNAPAVAAQATGAICGVAGLSGRHIAPIRGKGGCGIDDPVQIQSVQGVPLSLPLTLDCSVARALNQWVADVVKPAFADRLRRIDVAGGYVCRGRNNQAGAKLSEHARGRAVDVSGLTLTTGRITVARDWNRGADGQTMARAYKGGCGIFGTTLGPGSDGYHEDHMHFDVPSNRRSPYCR